MMDDGTYHLQLHSVNTYIPTSPTLSVTDFIPSLIMDSDPLPNTNQANQDKESNQKLKEHAPPPNTTSDTSSPSHEFSFTISLHSSNPNSISTSTDASWNCKTPNNSFAIDLSPADEIFFHGHLLPLGLLSQLPHTSLSPRSSTTSVDTSVGLPINDSRPKAIDNVPTIRNNSPKRIRPAKKSKSFSLFGLPGWKQSGERDESTKRKKQKKFSRLLKRYLAMVKKPLISFKRQWRGSDEDDIEIYIDRDSSYSFSGQIIGDGGRNISKYMKKQEFSSAPASIRTSPTNSGLLVPVPTLHRDNSSTMEELQAAIQAAITHCKNSIATADQGGKFGKGLSLTS